MLGVVCGEEDKKMKTSCTSMVGLEFVLMIQNIKRKKYDCRFGIPANFTLNAYPGKANSYRLG